MTCAIIKYSDLMLKTMPLLWSILTIVGGNKKNQIYTNEIKKNNLILFLRKNESKY